MVKALASLGLIVPLNVLSRKTAEGLLEPMKVTTRAYHA